LQTLTKSLVNQGFTNRVLNDRQFQRVSGGSKQSRYNLVDRALKAGELLRLGHGIYILGPEIRDFGCHPFAFAQALAPGSFISLESALAFHGWIPEQVYETASISPGRKTKRYVNEVLGSFSFHPLAINRGYFLEMVERVEVEGQSMFVAKPERALLDLVCLRKMSWKGLKWIERSLRIDHDYLRSIKRQDTEILKLVYKQNRVQRFLNGLCKELNIAGEGD